MGVMLKKLTIYTVLTISSIVFSYVALRAFIGFHQGYSWPEMDWNGDGHTTIAEILEATDIGKRQIVRDGKNCDEFYRFKDGLQIKTVCRA